MFRGSPLTSLLPGLGPVPPDGAGSESYLDLIRAKASLMKNINNNTATDCCNVSYYHYAEVSDES